MNTIIETIEKEFPDYVVMFERGQFCNVYYKDSYIVGFLMNYKVKEIGDGVTCGFPKSCINKVRSVLEEKEINYMLVDRKHCYDEDDKMEFKTNQYQELYDRAFKYVNVKKRLEDIQEYILNNIENEKVLKLIDKCEVYINETRKINSNKSC